MKIFCGGNKVASPSSNLLSSNNSNFKCNPILNVFDGNDSGLEDYEEDEINSNDEFLDISFSQSCYSNQYLSKNSEAFTIVKGKKGENKYLLKSSSGSAHTIRSQTSKSKSL